MSRDGGLTQNSEGSQTDGIKSRTRFNESNTKTQEPTQAMWHEQITMNGCQGLLLAFRFFRGVEARGDTFKLASFDCFYRGVEARGDTFSSASWDGLPRALSSSSSSSTSIVVLVVAVVVVVLVVV